MRALRRGYGSEMPWLLGCNYSSCQWNNNAAHLLDRRLTVLNRIEGASPVALTECLFEPSKSSEFRTTTLALICQNPGRSWERLFNSSEQSFGGGLFRAQCLHGIY